MRNLVLAVFLLLAPAAAWAAELVPLTVTTEEGVAHPFQVEIADSPDERARGLMFRKELAEDRGMLFLFPRRERIAMWMRNTEIPLDMLFISDDGRVTQIHERAVPHSEAVISSRRRVRYVLELPGGTADRLGLAPGALVTSEAMR
ncbi:MULTISPECIES: DUF192 domain-containing protein [Thalassobaculum]|uniref:DUF192 domain-containing protein n=1 Tax=Thalassobaculum litoreum DSM 18839 TaxID=1123362 RepID=A0A8G2BGD1_9PROT|nr:MULTISPECIES: DUF192 domain-containing protein [Thalassobaculum]SDF14223.1 hypothetical protein SAMN05660686_00429 [Thalassobaculum litoreum DSM 18839]